MNRRLHAIVFLASSVAALACAADAPAPTMTVEQLQRIVATAGITLSADGKRVVDPACGEVDARFETVDLNRDGAPELFLYYGDTCTSGATGVSLLLFVRDASGVYRSQLGFPAADYTPVPPGRLGFPDLEVRGMGFCAAVWRWDGKDYQHFCNRPDEPGGCGDRDMICAP